MKEQLKLSVTEKDVENVYRSEFRRLLPTSKITSPYNIDGLLEYKNVRSLLEFKFDVDLKSKRIQANIFTQIIYYLKRFEQNGQLLPSTLFVGDNNECFALETKQVAKFLNRNIDWELAPSTAHKSNPELIQALVDDINIAPMVFDVDESFRLRDIIKTLKDLSEGRVIKVTINKENIVEAFRYWKNNVLNDSSLNIQEEASIFIYCLVDDQNTYLHPNKKNTLVSSYDKTYKEVKINSDIHRSFFSHFNKDYKPSEIDIIISSKDRLVEEITRRKEGEFYTPTIWAYEAVKLISSIYGQDWKEKYIVWDCCSGLNNLTRDFTFNNLFSSTLNIEDINTVNKMGYNPEATIFQFDFLNDPIDKLPSELITFLKQDKPFIFYINPPFATAGERKSKSKNNKMGTADTRIRSLMKEHKFGRSTEQLYAQFIFRIYHLKHRFNLTNVNICFFSKPTFLVSPSFIKFREKFFNSFKFEAGILLRADNFSDVKNTWGVSFTIWSSGLNSSKEFPLTVKGINKNNMAIADYGEKIFYNSDNNSASSWARKPINNIKKVDAPQLSNPINVKQNGDGKVIADGLGYMHNNSNNLMQSDRYVGIYSSAFSDGHGIPISKGNLMRIVALFSARKSVPKNWINDKDEFLIPDTTLDGYQLWNNNALVYSLFHVSSNQSSLRDVRYKNKKYDINNPFFFLSNEEMMLLADKYHFHDMYRDAIRFNKNSYVYELLQTNNFSPKAKIVLDKAKNLVYHSMAFREKYHLREPKYNLYAWDAGWYQLRLGVIQQVGKLNEELKLFNSYFKELEDEIREGVYKYGFLKK